MLNGNLPDQILLLTWDLTNMSLEEFENLTQKISINSARIQRILEENSSSGFYSLKTCQRVLFMTWSHVHQYRKIIKSFEQMLGSDLTNQLLSLRGTVAFHHLASIASSLDSLVLGETQVLSQVRDSYKKAIAKKHLRPPLEFVVREAIRSAKRVFHETDLPRGKVSFLSLLEEEISILKTRQEPLCIALFGTGDMAKNTISLLRRISAQVYLDIYTNRQDLLAKGIQEENTFFSVDLPKKAKIRLFLVNNFYDRELPPYDVVFLATDKSSSFFTRKDAEKVISSFEKPSKKLLVIDLGVPRNSDPSISELDNVLLIQVSDLMERAKEGEMQRRKAVKQARPIIEAQVLPLSRKLFMYLEQERILQFRNDLEKALSRRKTQILSAIESNDHLLKLDKTLEQTFHEIIHISQKHFEKALMEGRL